MVIFFEHVVFDPCLAQAIEKRKWKYIYNSLYDAFGMYVSFDWSNAYAYGRWDDSK
jgi:hypothetical protein